ncbi:MAG TPA: DUF423 domain-containing protein [Caulobacterales bacterium]|nr:DUF423 domain-containing protein [Caulobacterales bacterium]
MRILNIVAALSGASALIALAASHHMPNFDAARPYVMMGGAVQLSAGLAGLAIANRSGRLNLIAGTLILGGAALFAGEIYLHSFADIAALDMAAPIGGMLSILGWIVLAFAKPSA